MKHPVKHGIRYIAFTATAYWVFEVILTAAIHRGVDLPQKHPLEPNTWIVEKRVLSDREWSELQRKHHIFLGITWVFGTGGSTVTLPSDFNTLSNQFNAVGAGGAGFGGSPSCGNPCNPITGPGGGGGGGGAFARITNYSAHGAGAVVNIQVGSGDTWFDSTSVLLAKAAAGQVGGQASASVGTLKNTGGLGGSGGGDNVGLSFSGGGGGGGGGAAGPNGAGAAGANGQAAVNGGTASGGTGGTGDGGNTAAGANGAQFGPNGSSAFAGPGGGATGGPSSPSGGTVGGNAGFYGGGGGGGGGASNTAPAGNGGNATQGLLAFSYTPASGGGSARSFGLILG